MNQVHNNMKKQLSNISNATRQDFIIQHCTNIWRIKMIKLIKLLLLLYYYLSSTACSYLYKIE